MKIKTHISNLENYKVYLQVEQATHAFMKKRGYLKVDVPVLSPALIPESYLEIFETKFNYFDRKESLYLTPSPELFLKRLLVSGIKDIYYLGKSFRNSEPNSSFHLPEFTMLEFYRVGYSYLELADEILELMKYIDDKIKNQKAEISFKKWEQYTVAEAFEKFSDISERALFDEKLFLKKAQEKGYKTGGFNYQDIFSQIISQEVEIKLGVNGSPAMLYDYPKQMASLAKLNKDGKTAKRVEFYIDGVEIGGCCEELSDWKEQEGRFKQEDLNRRENNLINHTIDKGFIEALKYGLPDCTGAGIGFERLCMALAGVKSISELKLISLE